jgi:hypothetical protein
VGENSQNAVYCNVKPNIQFSDRGAQLFFLV